MVQRYKSEVRVYEKPFELVVMAYQKRWEFPKCELIPALISSEILEEDLNEDGSVHIVKRRCKIGVDAPFIIKKFAGLECMEFIQVHPENPDWTCFEQSACIEVKAFFGFEGAVEKLAVKSYARECINKGKEIIEFHLEQLRKEGITHVERFKLPPQTPPASNEVC